MLGEYEFSVGHVEYEGLWDIATFNWLFGNLNLGETKFRPLVPSSRHFQLITMVVRGTAGLLLYGGKYIKNTYF